MYSEGIALQSAGRSLRFQSRVVGTLPVECSEHFESVTGTALFIPETFLGRDQPNCARLDIGMASYASAERKATTSVYSPFFASISIISAARALRSILPLRPGTLLGSSTS
jgi:hypothetical protein